MASKTFLTIIEMRNGSEYKFYSPRGKHCTDSGRILFEGYADSRMSRKSKIIADSEDILVICVTEVEPVV